MGTDVKITVKLKFGHHDARHRLCLELVTWNLPSTKGSTAGLSLAPVGASEGDGWSIPNVL